MTELGVRAVFVGEPSVLGYQRAEPVYSAIGKDKVAAASLELGEINLDGDDQADRTVHGGVDKAVYVYPAEHYPRWAADDFLVETGDFGENVSVSGLDEETIRVGDVWAWGGALVQVAQPRIPCFKLAMKTGRKEIIPAMIDSGRCGWYLRVLRTGEVPTTGAMTLAERDPTSPTIAEVYVVSFANLAGLDEERRAAYFRLARTVVKAPALAGGYRDSLVARLEKWETRYAR